MTPPLQIAAWNFWSPSGCDVLEWLPAPDQHSEGVEVPAPVESVTAMQRRRMSRLSRMAMQVATELPGSDAAGYFVFCSRHGEIQRTASILDDLAGGIEPSPTSFAMSVHNTSAGLFSIARQLRTPSTSVCAGEFTFLAGWIESAAWISAHPDDSVVLVMFDENLPELLLGDVPHATRPHSMALRLVRGDKGVRLEATSGREGPEHTVGPHFLAWWLSGARTLPVCVEEQGWQWSRDD